MKAAPLLLLLWLQILLTTSCHFAGGKKIKGNGHMISQQMSVGSFTSLSTSGNIDIIVTDGVKNMLRIETDENLIDYLEVKNHNGIVDIHTKNGYNLRPKNGIRVFATAPVFSSLEVSGNAKIKSTGKIKGDKLHASVNGSGDINLDVDTPQMEADISGSGSATVRGSTRDFSASVSGSGDIRCFDLLSENTEIDIAGSGNAEVFASKTLDVDISGAGDVRYKGNPTVKQSIAGAGSVRKAD